VILFVVILLLKKINIPKTKKWAARSFLSSPRYGIPSNAVKGSKRIIKPTTLFSKAEILILL
jgi:hypothetical protein